MEKRKTLVIHDFEVPAGLETRRFILRMLPINDLVKDYDAVMSSVDPLRYSFAYTVMTPDEIRCVGCVYLNPSPRGCYDVEISMWVRASELCNDLDSELYNTVRNWIDEVWPFSRPAYHGRKLLLKIGTKCLVNYRNSQSAYLGIS